MRRGARIDSPAAKRYVRGMCRWRAACAIAVVLAGAACPAPAEPAPAPGKPLTFAVIPFYAAEKIYALYTPFVEYLRRTTGVSWELKLYHNHAALIDGFCAGEVDVALFGPVPMARVNEKCDGAPFLVALSPEALPTYRSVLITADPAVASLADLRGRAFGFFRGSTAAHILPAKILRDAGVLEAVRPAFFPSQDAILNALATREISGAGIKESLYRRVAAERFRVLAISGAVPNFSFATRPGAAPAVRGLFARALLGLNPKTSPADAETVRGWDDEIRNGFLEPPPGFLESVTKLSALTEVVLGGSRQQ